MATVLVTGANRGIGLELCRQLVVRGDDVIAACRTSSVELDEVGARVEVGIDVASDRAVADLASHLSALKLDVLINNAGMLTVESLEDLNIDRIRRQLEVNALGPLRVTAALRSNLQQGSKVAFMTSRMGSIADNGSGGYYGYRMSKAALNAAGMSLARDLAREGIAVITLHPGFVRTEMTRNMGAVEPADAAASLIERIDELTLDSTGRFLHANGEELPW